MQTNMMDSPIKTIQTEDNTIVTPSPPSMKRTWLDNFSKKTKKRMKTFVTKKRTGCPQVYKRKRSPSLETNLNRTKKQQQTYIDSDIESDYDISAIAEENTSLFQGIVTLRLAIAFYYRCILNAPPEYQWEGETGPLSKIKEVFE